MKKYVIIVVLNIFISSVFCFDFDNTLQIQFGPNRQTGFKSTQLNTDAIYKFSVQYFEAETGIAFDAETFDLEIALSGKYDLMFKFFSVGVKAGILYHDLWFYKISVDQDFVFHGKLCIGCPFTKTQIYAAAYYGWKNTTVYEIESYVPFLTDSFTNYDIGLSQKILRTSWDAGIATYSFFRHDFRFIPELYLKGNIKLTDNLSLLPTLKLLFSDISNKTCHPEYLFFKAGIEWRF